METWMSVSRVAGGAYVVQGHLNDDQVAALLAAKPFFFKVGADAFSATAKSWQGRIYINVRQGGKAAYSCYLRKNQYGAWFVVESPYCGFCADKFTRNVADFVRAATGCGDGNEA